MTGDGDCRNDEDWIPQAKAHVPIPEIEGKIHFFPANFSCLVKVYKHIFLQNILKGIYVFYN